jgi:hypothetical protein
MIKLYAGDKPVDPGGVSLGELLCDLLVWSRREGINLPATLRRAVQVRDVEHLAEGPEGASWDDD